MKAAFGAEAIGLGNEALDCGWVLRNERPWVAEVVGRHPKYTFERRFLRYKTDYREANSKATRGVWFWWTLESGRIYETRYRTAWSWFHRKFLRVTEDGDVIEMTREEVEAWLNEASASTS